MYLYVCACAGLTTSLANTQICLLHFSVVIFISNIGLSNFYFLFINSEKKYNCWENVEARSLFTEECGVQ